MRVSSFLVVTLLEARHVTHSIFIFNQLTLADHQFSLLHVHIVINTQDCVISVHSVSTHLDSTDARDFHLQILNLMQNTI